MTKEKTLILASASPRRRQLLNMLGLDFKVIPSEISEDIPFTHPAGFVETLAAHKAKDVASRCINAFVVAADTIVILDGQLLGKPSSEEEAASMLARLSNKTHEVYTGVCVLETNERAEIEYEKVFHECTKVRFAALEKSEIRHYVASGSPLDKAGAYGIQDDWGSVFVKKIEGDYYNVVGFPIHRFYTELKGRLELYKTPPNNV